MPYNGSGSFTLAEAPFVPNTPISSAAVNSDLSDIATNGLTNAVTKDGQTTITGPFKGANGSVGAPMYSFASDTNTGIYRIAADNIGISAGGTKILDIGAGGLTSTYLVQPAGTVLLPSYTFSGDLDSGIYQIGANNIGVAVNAAKVLDISTAGLNVIGSVSSNGAAFSPTAQGAGMVNGTIVESHTGNAVTFAIKTLAGADPSATDIVYVNFRNVTAATGNYVTLQITAALSLVVSSGSTLGTSSSNVPFRLWLVLFNDAGTIRLGVINCTTSSASATIIYPLRGFEIATSTAEGGAGGADLAQTFYTGTAVTSKAYAVIGYASYETGVTTAGSWASTPTRLQLYENSTPLPGETVQTTYLTTTTVGSTTSATMATLTSGSSLAITPTSAANLVQVASCATLSQTAAANSLIRILRGAVVVGNPIKQANVTGGPFFTPGTILAIDFPQVSTSTNYILQGQTDTGTVAYPATGTGLTMKLDELMA